MSTPTQAQSTGAARSSPGVLAIPNRIDLVFVLVAVFSTGAGTPLVRATAAPALAIAFWRCFAGAILSGLTVLPRWREARDRLDRRSVGFALLAGVFLGGNFGLWNIALKMTSVASATALVSVQVVFAALIAWRLGDRMAPMAWVGAGICIASIGLITGADFDLSRRAVIGDLLAVATAVFGAAYFTAGGVARRRLAAGEYSAICFGMSAAVLLASCLIGRQDLAGYSTTTWLELGVLVVTSQILGHFLFNIALRSASATFISLANLGLTPIASIVAYFALDQLPAATAIPGILLLLTGALIVIRYRGRAVPPLVID